MNYNFFIIISILQLYLAIEDFNINCKNKNIFNYFILILHHLFDVYVFFGIFMVQNDYEQKIHFFTILFVLLLWIINNYKCFLTEYLNKLCLINPNQWLFSLMYQLYKITNFYYIHSFWIIIIILININKYYLT